MRKMNCTLEYVNGHIEVYDDTGAFLFSADNKCSVRMYFTDFSEIKKEEIYVKIR